MPPEIPSPTSRRRVLRTLVSSDILRLRESGYNGLHPVAGRLIAVGVLGSEHHRNGGHGGVAQEKETPQKMGRRTEDTILSEAIENSNICPPCVKYVSSIMVRFLMGQVIAYIDGFNLYYGLREKKWYRYYWLNLWELALKLLEADDELSQVKYFTARVSAKSDVGKSRRQNIYIEALETLPCVRVFYGHYLAQKTTCGKCGSVAWIPKEKMTDVNIATELLVDAHQDRFRKALLISADSDLVPPVKAIRNLYPHKRIVVAFPPKRFSKALSQESSAYFSIGRGKLKDSQLPDEVEKPGGFVLRRPATWV